MTRLLLVGLALAAAATRAGADELPRPPAALGVDMFASSDAEHTDVWKVALNADWRHSGADDYQGLRLERAVFKPLGQPSEEDLRVYYRFADRAGGWTWNGQAGTDGDTLLGAASIHNDQPFRQEYFLERDIVETPQGLTRRLYYTFAGGALDMPIDARDTLTWVGALQDFTGRNLRTHVRVNYVHVLQPDWGLSAQLRVRYFHSTNPGEFDYFSPRDFVQVTPTLQLRRRIAGWRALLAAGAGAQRQTGGDWRAARTVTAQLSSPSSRRGWSLEGTFAYSNTPVGVGVTYDYRELTLGLRRAF